MSKLVAPPKAPLYKLLEDGKSRESYVWSLPSYDEASQTWAPGAWHEINGEMVQCRNGLHFTTDPSTRLAHTNGVDPECYVVEVEGRVFHRAGDDEVCARKARLVRRCSHEEMGRIGLVQVEGPAPNIPLYVTLSDEDCPKPSDEGWALPTREDGRWVPGAWRETTDALVRDEGDVVKLWTSPMHGERLPRIYVAEARGNVLFPFQYSKSYVAREARLVRKLSWNEMRKLGAVKGNRPVRDRETPVLTFLRYMTDRSRASDRKVGYAVEHAIMAAVEARLRFTLDDFALINRDGRLGLWCAREDSGESLYRWLVAAGHESALRSFESWRGRSPWIVRGERVCEGSQIRWKKGKQAAWFTVTGFDDQAGTMRAARHAERERDREKKTYRSKLDGGYEYESKVVQRVTFTHAEIDAAEKARVLHVTIARQSKKIADGLKSPPDYTSGSFPVSVEQVMRWTADQRREALAYLKGLEKNPHQKERPPPPAFVLEASAELRRFEARAEMKRTIQKRKHKALGKKWNEGKPYEWEIKVSEEEIDAEEARVATKEDAA